MRPRRIATVVGAMLGLAGTAAFMPPTTVANRAAQRNGLTRRVVAASAGGDRGEKGARKTAVLFDFDGTLGDTETPAMEVAFWELAPYLLSLVGSQGFDESRLESIKHEFIQDNAGRAFEFMVEEADAERKAQGLPSIEEKKEVPSDPRLLDALNAARKRFGLKSIEDVTTQDAYPDILIQQKEETNQALAFCTVPNPGVVEVCGCLTSEGIPFCIATTSGKPRVPISVKAAKLDEYFPSEKIHSGESDFNPPRFKPDPSVYLLAAETEGCAPSCCIAVEDSGSGVGSAANAKIGFIIGYVGGTHIPETKKESHAKMLMSGGKSDDGRGAEVVVEEFTDILPLVVAYRDVVKDGKATGPSAVKKVLIPEALKSLKGRVWLPTPVTA